jgi:hypothetical protein
MAPSDEARMTLRSSSVIGRMRAATLLSPARGGVLLTFWFCKDTRG